MKRHRRQAFFAFKFELFGSTLSGRVLWLTVIIILLMEIMVLMPNLGGARQNWLWNHVTRAYLAAFSASRAPGGTPDLATRAALLQLAGAQSVKLLQPGQPEILLQAAGVPVPRYKVNLATETLAQSTWQADLLIVGAQGGTLEVIAPSLRQPGVRLDIMVNGDTLSAYLRAYAERAIVLAAITALVTGLLVFAALDRLLVRPMRIITESIIGFRQDPTQGNQGELIWLAGRRQDEVSAAAGELKITQDEMRAALWRNARLAALGTSVAKISHDLRNILSSALLVADRLQEISDPAVKRAANMLIPAVERATQLVSRTLDFAREGPPAITRTAVTVRELVDEVAMAARPDEPDLVDNQVPENLVLALDRDQIFRVLLNLVRNAAEAGADRITLSVATANGVTRMQVRDNGPGLPPRVQESLFKPFNGSGRQGGSGLGLAIARDLIRAHGGELVLAHTGPRGTVFVMDLAVSETQV